jgi:uncharacterized protein YgfB (UPF0149 family)
MPRDGLQPHVVHQMTATPYDRLAHCLSDGPLSASPAEVHGILCGLICAGHPRAEAVWLAEVEPVASEGDLLAQASTKECRRQLDALARRTRDDIEGPGLGFVPLLPPDDDPLRARAEAVYDWCRGFLYALGVAGIGEQDLSEQTREVFRDFGNITRMDLNGLDDGEDNEDALMEVTEFIWVAAMLVYEERVAAMEAN